MLHKPSLYETAKLKMLTASFGPALFDDPLKAKFEEIYRDVNVDLTYAQYGVVHDKIVSAMRGGGATYDVFMVDNIWIPEFVEAGWLEDVTRYVTPELKKSVFPASLEAAEYPAGSGRYYGLPWYIDAKYLFYNKTMLSKAGITEPPKTLDELWSQAMTIKKKGIVKHPIAWSWTQQECLICDYIILTRLFGGRLVDEAGKPVFNKGGAVAALKWMAKSIEEGITSWASLAFAEPDVVRVLGAEDAAFALLWLSSYDNVNDPQLLAGACGVTNAPGSDILPEGVSVNGSTFFGISSGCKRKDAAVDLVKFWAGLDPEKSYVKWFFPMWMRLFDTPKMFREGVYDILDVVKYQYAHMVTRPRTARYAILSRELQRAIHEALTKMKTPQEALNDAVKRLTTKIITDKEGVEYGSVECESIECKKL